MEEDDLYGEWRRHLTPELRRKFERKGPEIVQAEIGAYSTSEKRQAAQVWLAEKRAQRASTDTIRFWIITGIAAATLIATLIGVYLAAVASMTR